ncbi:MAG: hypothetical protein Fur0028_15430 [Bacteroidales bacterium]
MIFKIIKYITLVIGSLAILSNHSTQAQQHLDFGLFVGGSYYQGDINTSRIMYSPGFSYGGFIRYAFHTRWAVRGSIFSGNLKGNDQNFSYQYQHFRNVSFSTPIVEATGQIELNFKPYRIGDKKKKWTPYVFTGATFLVASYADHVYQPVIPFGFGIKANLAPRLGMGIEWAYRKTFTDGLDNLSWYKHLPTTSTEHDYLMLKQYAYHHQKDYYAFIGIFLTYKIRLTDEVCNAWE